MNRWREFIYDFPDDDGQTLYEVLGALPARFGPDLTWMPFGGWRLQLANSTAAVFLRMAIPALGVADERFPFLDPLDLYVPWHLRNECETELAERCPSHAIWTDLNAVSMRTEEVRLYFDGLYRLVLLARPRGDRGGANRANSDGSQRGSYWPFAR